MIETETVSVCFMITEQVEARIALEKSRSDYIFTIRLCFGSGNYYYKLGHIWRRRRAEDELRNERLFRTTLLSVGDGVITTDQNGCVNIMNDVAEQITGWTQQEAMGLPLEVVFIP